MEKIETYTRPQARDPRLQKSTKSETRPLGGTLYIEWTATDTTNVTTTSAQRRSRVNHTVSAETESRESHRCEITPIQKMARKATEEQKAAELKNKVQTVKKSPEEQQHTADDVLKDVAQKQQEVQQRVQQYTTVEEARAIAPLEAVESKGREAAVEASREGGC